MECEFVSVSFSLSCTLSHIVRLFSIREAHTESLPSFSHFTPTAWSALRLYYCCFCCFACCSVGPASFPANQRAAIGQLFHHHHHHHRTHLAAIVNTLSLLTLTHHHHHRRPAHYPSIQHSHSRFSSTSQSVTGIQFTHVKHSHSHSMNP